MLAVYPIPELEGAGTVAKLGDTYILRSPTLQENVAEKQRGRPPLPWDLFHVEVAARASSGSLPAKKEAAIIELTEWFRQEHKITVSRSSVGQKLTPYYQRLFRSAARNPGREISV